MMMVAMMGCLNHEIYVSEAIKYCQTSFPALRLLQNQ